MESPTQSGKSLTETQEEKSGIFDQMSPIQIFVLGIVEGFLVLCTIGFFLLLSILLRGSGALGSYLSAGSDFVPSVEDTAGSAVVDDTVSGPVAIRPVDVKTDHIRGNKNATISVIEFSDFQCPFCKSFDATMKQVIETYGDDVRWVYRHFPLDSLHPNARNAALASECASEQGKFWEFSDMMFADQNNLGESGLKSFASALGLKTNQFTTCLQSKKYAKDIVDDETEVQQSGGRGTPYSIVIGPNGETSVINGAQSFAAVEAAIQQFLE
ncbi:MAG TPA: hypothetical protein DCY48_04040 [Candidatus Magasanikbacteria bacterium]|nr:MAG: hypothetical protein A3I74_00405 [Candidatus Magasanikbacteria bacterium RIFCSPLOWO2_02_FULL_47_16]OGH80088.1 MAG: hypothetical protein A3C10_02820 [Candidatus Magasanikbacteria bacterium RIFCSPHIGHO2_02_FULL_48_18]OGH83327.1 MAG: hypothetical protein A3G08_00280 [Candidatus Magasanikbacteria bacterium RIFCSPLOWO2_12_FULL_47_9b]HAZ28915.1 hypothetical protein [Candidatus Magasanikbacteria bacterium]